MVVPNENVPTEVVSQLTQALGRDPTVEEVTATLGELGFTAEVPTPIGEVTSGDWDWMPTNAVIVGLVLMSMFLYFLRQRRRK